MSSPAKAAFSQKYRSYGICGAFGLSDHGFWSDMGQVQTCTRRREEVSMDGEGGRDLKQESDLGAR